MRTLERQGDLMVATETAPLIIDFQDILNCTSVVHDERNYETPWDNCNGFEHTTRRATYADRDRGPRGMCWSQGNRERIVIELDEKADCGLYEYLRARGASKQVAMEAVACQWRRTLDQLVSWYENGWEWFGVKCDFEILGNQYSFSVWGIDCAEFAEKEMVPEIASEVARQLEADNFTVVGWPVSNVRGYKRERARFGLSLGTWKD